MQIWVTLFKITLCYQLKDIVQNHQSHWEPKNWEMGVIREVRNTHGHFTVYLVRLCSLQRSNWIITGKSLLLQYPHIFPLIDKILLYTRNKSARELREYIFYFILVRNMFFSFQSKQEKCCAVLKCRLSGPPFQGKLWLLHADCPTECGLWAECCSLLAGEILKYCRVMAINVAAASISALSLKLQKAKEWKVSSCQNPDFHPSNTA